MWRSTKISVVSLIRLALLVISLSGRLRKNEVCVCVCLCGGCMCVCVYAYVCVCAWPSVIGLAGRWDDVFRMVCLLTVEQGWFHAAA